MRNHWYKASKSPSQQNAESLSTCDKSMKFSEKIHTSHLLKKSQKEANLRRSLLDWESFISHPKKSQRLSLRMKHDLKSDDGIECQSVQTNWSKDPSDDVQPSAGHLKAKVENKNVPTLDSQNRSQCIKHPKAISGSTFSADTFSKSPSPHGIMNDAVTERPHVCKRNLSTPPNLSNGVHSSKKRKTDATIRASTKRLSSPTATEPEGTPFFDGMADPTADSISNLPMVSSDQETGSAVAEEDHSKFQQSSFKARQSRCPFCSRLCATPGYLSQHLRWCKMTSMNPQLVTDVAAEDFDVPPLVDAIEVSENDESVSKLSLETDCADTHKTIGSGHSEVGQAAATLVKPRCRYCSRSYATRRYLKLHERACKMAPTTESKGHSEVGQADATLGKPRCRYCSRPCANPGYLKLHERACKMTPQSLNSSTQSEPRDPSFMDGTETAENSTSKLPALENAIFNAGLANDSLRKARSSNTSQSSCVCPYCSRVFKWPSRMKLHLHGCWALRKEVIKSDVHSDASDFTFLSPGEQCPHCSRSFTKSAHLKTHLCKCLRLSSETDSTMDQRASTNDDSLVEAVPYNTSTPSSECPLCSRVFSRPSRLKLHWRKCSAVPTRDQTLDNSKSFNHSVQETIPNIAVNPQLILPGPTCPHCSYRFSRPRNLKMHLRRCRLADTKGDVSSALPDTSISTESQNATESEYVAADPGTGSKSSVVHEMKADSDGVLSTIADVMPSSLLDKDSQALEQAVSMTETDQLQSTEEGASQLPLPVSTASPHGLEASTRGPSSSPAPSVTSTPGVPLSSPSKPPADTMDPQLGTTDPSPTNFQGERRSLKNLRVHPRSGRPRSRSTARQRFRRSLSPARKPVFRYSCDPGERYPHMRLRIRRSSNGSSTTTEASSSKPSNTSISTTVSADSVIVKRSRGRPSIKRTSTESNGPVADDTSSVVSDVKTASEEGPKSSSTHPYICLSCRDSFESWRLLSAHRPKCPMRSKSVTRSVTSLGRNRGDEKNKLALSIRLWPCLTCGQKFRSRAVLRSHIAMGCSRSKLSSSKASGRFRCPGCPNDAPLFSSTEDILEHLLSLKPGSGHAHGNFGTNRRWPATLVVPNLGFGCHICGLLLASESRLDKHKRAVHESWLLAEQQRTISPAKCI